MKRQRTPQEKIRLLVLTGLFAAVICLFTAYICHIPMGANGGYLHFGDTLIYVAAALLPQPYALLAAPMWAPATILIKALITLPFTWKGRKLLCTRNRIAPFVSWILSTIGYYLAEGLLFGQYAALITSVMGSALQSGGSLLFFYLVAGVLDRQDVKSKVFTDSGSRLSAVEKG